MSTQLKSELKSPHPIEGVSDPIIPPLEVGDHLSRDEFERRYEAMPDIKKAELIEGVVYMPSPVSAQNHGEPHFDVIGWLAQYRAKTPGVHGGDNTTVRLDLDNEPQPDAYLRILAEFGGRTRTVDGFVEGPPEWIGEIAASSASYDLHGKLNAYRRNGIREYLVWRVLDKSIDWHVLRGGQYEKLSLGADGIYRSEVFPGLWLDAAALIRRDLGRVLDVLQAGLASEEHARFVETLNKKQ
jgi:Uma2 family endonuclease